MKKIVFILTLLFASTTFAQVKTIEVVEPVIEEVSIKTQQEPIYEIVEESASFPGGMKALVNYLKKNLHYPEVDVENGVQGKVYVQFIVQKDGTLHNVKVLRGVSESLDKESIRLIKGMPNWIPGKQNGEIVATYMRLPIQFKLD